MRLIGRRNVPRLTWIMLLMIGVAVLEFVSIGSFFPLLTLMFDPAGAASGRVADALGWLGIDASGTQAVARLGLLVLLLFIGKTLFTGWALREAYRFSYTVQVEIGHRLLRGLLGRSYEFHLNSNSAVLLKNVTAEVLSLAANVLNPAISLVSQTFVLLALFGLLFWISPAAALALLALVGVATAAIYAVSHNRLRTWGRTREERLADLHRVAQASLLGVKTVKTHGAESHFLREYVRIGHDYAALNTRYQVAAAVPPLLLELFMFGGFTALVLYHVLNGENLVATLPLIGIMGAAAFRMLPAGRRIFFNLVTIRYFWSSMEAVEGQIQSVAAPASAAGTAGAEVPPLREDLTLDGVSYAYPDGRLVLQDISLRIRHGSRIGIVGGSGAGKTTLLDLIIGLLQPDRGRILVDGEPIDETRARSWLEQVGYVPQQTFLIDGTIRDNVAFGVADPSVDDSRILEVLRQTQLMSMVERLPDGLDTPIGEDGVRLSGGERQRLGIARALYRRPRLLIFDEATSAIDTVTEHALTRDVLDSCGDATVLVVAHRIPTVSACDRIVVLHEGRVHAVGRYDDLLRTSSVFAELERHGSVNAGGLA